MPGAISPLSSSHDEGTERISKMRRAAETSKSNFDRRSKFQNKAETSTNRWKNIDFPRIEEQTRARRPPQGRYIMLKLANEDADINEAHPMLVSKVIEQYFQGNTEQRRTRKAILMKTRDKKQLEKFQSLNKPVDVTIFGKTEKVVVEELKSKNTSQGIIFQNSWTQMTIEEVKTGLSIRNQIREVKQIMKFVDGKEQATNGYIITFDDPELPEHVYMYGQRHAIRRFYPNPLICGKCLKFGHIKKKCTDEWTCRKCGFGKQDEHICQDPVKCPNCPEEDKAHAPNKRRVCGRFEFECEITKYRVDHGVSFVKAREKVLTSLRIVDERLTQLSSNTKNETAEPISKEHVANDNLSTIERLKLDLTQEEKETQELVELRDKLVRQCNEKKKLLEEIAARKCDIEAMDCSEIQKTDENKLNNSSKENEAKRRKTQQKIKFVRSKVLKREPENGSKVSPSELQVIKSTLTKELKKAIESVETKAYAKMKDIVWYIDKEELIPLETNLKT